MSTCVEDGILQVRRAGQPKDIPKVIDTYNKNMGGVDRSDQMLTSYEIERKRVKKWYKKFFYHLVMFVFSMHISLLQSWEVKLHNYNLERNS